MAATGVTSPAFAPIPAEISTVDFSFLVPWFGVLYHLFPALSYLVTKDWKKVFYDCFGPQILVADTFTSLITFWFHIFCPRKDEALKFVILHSFGLGLNVMSICMFAMFHSLSGGIKRAKYWYYLVLGSFALVVLLTFMWMQMDITIEKENDKRANFGYVLAAVAEIYQVFWPAIVRVVLSMINIISGCLQLVVRYIGPERFAEPVQKYRNQCYEWTAEKLAQAKRLFCGGDDD